MTYQPKPRRCSKRWLDGDCPDGVLAILDSKHDTDRYTILFAEVFSDGWLTGLGTNESGSFSGLFEMEKHKVAAYRYRAKHQYIRWTDLPDTVQSMVRGILADMEAAS